MTLEAGGGLADLVDQGGVGRIHSYAAIALVPLGLTFLFIRLGRRFSSS
jgi:hypothetical protein